MNSLEIQLRKIIKGNVHSEKEFKKFYSVDKFVSNISKNNSYSKK